jgi:hypothetical protein
MPSTFSNALMRFSNATISFTSAATTARVAVASDPVKAVTAGIVIE